jgi:hypothetical protein
VKLSKSIYAVWVIALFCAAMGLALLSGCTGFAPVRSTQVTLRPAETNQTAVVTLQPLVATNTVLTTTVTAGKTNVIATPLVSTNIVMFTNYVTQVIPAITYQSNYIAPPWFAATETIGELAPFPWVHTATTSLLALSATFLGWMNRRNAAKALATLTALDEAKIVGNTLVDNFETLRRAALTIPAYETIDHKVMDIVKAAQSLSGAKKTIAAIVDERTVNTL